MKKVYLFLLMCCISIAGYSQTVYYNTSGTAPNVANNWTTDNTGAGAGTHATSFSNPGDVFNLNFATVALTGTWTLDAVTLNINTALSSTKPMTLNGTTVVANANMSFTAGSASLTVGDGTHATSVTMVAGNLSFSNATAKLIIAANGTVDMQTNTISAYMPTTISNNGLFRTASTSATPYPTGKDFTNANTATGTVEFYSASNQTIIAGTHYNLLADGGASSTKTTGAITVKNNLYIGACTFALGGTTTVSNNVIDSATGTLSLGSSTLNIGGDFTNSGTLTAGTGTIAFNATTGTHTVDGNFTSPNNFKNLTFSGAGGTWQFGAGATNVDVSGNFTQSNGTVTTPTGTLNIGGNFSHTSGTFTNAVGTVNLNGVATQSVTCTSPTTFSTLTIDNTTSRTVAPSGTVTIQSSFTIPTGITLSLGTSSLTLGNDYTNNGTLTAGTSTVTFNATTTGHTLNGTLTGATGRFYNVTFDGVGGAWSYSGNGEVVNLLTINNGTVTAPSGTLTITGSYNNNIAGTGVFNNNGGTVIFNAATAGKTLSGNMTGSSKFNNLSFTGASPGSWNMGTTGVEVAGNLTASGTGTVTATTDTLKVGGNFIHSAGSVNNFVANGGTVSLNGSADQSITNTQPTTFNNLVLAGSARNILPTGTMTVLAPFTIPGGITLNMGTTLATFSDNFTNNGTFTSGTGTVTFNATSGSHTINGNLTGSNKFYKLTFNAAGSSWQFGATGTTPVEIGNTFTITNGTVTAPSDTMTLGGNFTFTAGSFIHNGGTVVYNSTAAQSVAGVAYNNLVLTGTTAAKTAGGTYTVAGNMNITTTTGAVTLNASSIAGNLNITTGTGIITLASALDVDGSISVSAGTNTANAAFDVSASNYSINVGGNWNVSNTGTATGIFNGRAGTVIFDGTGTQTIASTGGVVLPNFFNFQNANTANTVSVSNNMTVTGSLTNNMAAVLNTGAVNITVGANWTNNGTITNTGTVTFNSAVAGRTLSGSMAGASKFNNLTFSGASPGTWSMGANPVEVSGNLTISGTGTLTATSDTLKVGGNFVHSAGTASNFNANGGAVMLNGTGTQTFPGSIATTFNVLNVANTSAIVSANQAVTISGALQSAAGSTINMVTQQLLGTFDATAHNGYLQTQNATTPLPSGMTWGGIVEYNSTAANQTVAGSTFNNLWLTGTTKTKTISNGTMVNGTLNIHTTTGVVTLGGNLDVNGSINLVGTTANNILDASTFQINCAGNWTDSSTTATTLFKANTGTVVFDGTGAQTISSSGGAVVPNFYNFRNSNTVSPISLTSNTSITGSLTIDTSAVLNVSSPTLTLAGDFVNNGTYSASGAQTITVAGNWTNNGTFTGGVGSVTFNATTAGHTISGNLTGTNKFNNLTFSGNSPATWTFASVNVEAGGDFVISGTGTVNSTPAILRVGGNFGHNAGTAANFNANGGTVRLNGTASQTLPGTITTNFNTLALSNTTPRMITATTTMTIAAAFTIPSGDTLNMAAIPLTCSNNFTNAGVYKVSGAQVLSVSGDFANSGTFTCGTGATALTVGGGFSNTGSFDASTGTVTFNGTTGGSISGDMTGTNKFNNLTFNNAAGSWNFGASAAEVGSVLNLTNGTITAPSSTLTVTGNFVHAATATFNHNNGTVQLNGSAQTMPASATTFYSLNLSNPSGTVTANAATTIANSLLSAAGNTLNMGTNQLLGSFTATGMAGTVTTQHIATTAPVPSGTTWGGTVNFNSTAAGAQTVPSGTYNNLSLTGASGGKKSSGVSSVAGNLSITTAAGYDSLSIDSVGGNYSQVTTSGITSLGNSLIVKGNMSIAGTSTTNIFDVTAANYQVTLGGDLSLSSTTAATLINARAGLFVFKGTGSQTISTSSSGGALLANFFNFQNSNTASPISLSNNATVSGDMTIDNGAVLNVSAPTVTLNGNFLNNGTYATSGAQTLNIKGNYTNNGTFTAGTGTVAFTATTAGHTLSGNMIGSNKFNNLSFTGASPGAWAFNNAATVDNDFTISGTGAVTAPSDSLTVNGNFAHNSGTAANFKANGGTVILNSSSSQTIPGTIATTFSTLTISGSPRKLTANGAITIGNTFTIPSGDTLDMVTFALVDSNNFTNNGAYTSTGAQTLTIGGSYANNGSFNSTGTVVMNSALAGNTLSGSMTGSNAFNNLSFTGANPGAWAFNDSADVAGNFTISGTGAVTAPSSILKLTGNFVHSTGTFLHNNGTVYLNSSLNQTLPGTLATTFGTLSISNNLKTITLNKNITVVNAFTVPSNVVLSTAANAIVDSSDFTNNGTYSPTGAQALTVKGNFNNAGIFTCGTGSTALTISGSYTNTGTFNASTGTVVLNASTAGNTMAGSMTGSNGFNNLSFTGTGAITAGDSIDVAVNFTESGAGTFTAPASIMKISGNFSHSGGTFVHNSGTVYLNGTGTQTVPGTVATTFNTLSISNDARTITQNKGVTTVAAFTIPSLVTYNAAANALTDSSDFTINGSFNTTGTEALIVRGNLVNNGTFSNTGSQSTTIGGSYNNAGSFTAATGTVTFNGGTGGLTLTGAMTGSNKFNNIVFNNALGSWSFDTNAADAGGSFTITNGSVTAPSSMLKVNGNFAHNGGSFDPNNGSVELSGTTLTMPGTAATTFYNLNISNGSAAVTANGATTINHTLTTAMGSTVNMVTFQLLGSFDATGHNGTLSTQHVATAAPVPSGLSWGGTVNFNANTGTETVASGTYNNLNVTSTSGTKPFAGAVTVNGDFTLTTASGIATLGGALNVAGNISITGTTSNNVFDASASNYPITVGGNWTVNSSTATNLFNGRAGTVTFNGTGMQTISTGAGAVVPDFFNLTYSNTNNPLSLANNINVTGTFSVSAGTTIIPDPAAVINSAAAAGAITGSGTIQVTRTAAIADYLNQYKFTTNTLSGLKVDYSASGDQGVNSFTYGTLRTSGSGIKSAQGDITVNNLLDVSGGTTLDMGTSSNLISGTAPVYSVTGTLATSVPTATSATPLPTGLSWGGTIQYGAAAGDQTVVSGTYTNLTLSNTSGINTLGGIAMVNGTLALGKIAVGSNNLILANSSSVTGASSSNYVVTAGTGRFRRMFTADGSFTFALGDSFNYSPITIAMTGSGYSGAYVDGSVVPSKSVNNLNTNNYLNRTWTISTSGITSPSWSVTNATYVPSDIIGLESAMISAAYVGSLPWLKFTVPASDTLATGAIASNIAEISAITAAVPTVDVTPATPAYCSGGSSVLTATGGGGSGTLVYTWAPATALSATTGTVVTANPTTTDTTSYVTYTVTVTDGNGSYSTATVTLTVNPQPSAITGTLTVCEGATTALSNTLTGGTWTSSMTSVATVGSSSGIVSGVLAGNTTISYTMSTGCYVSAIVTVNQSPSAISGNLNVCEGHTTALSNSISGGTWASSNMSVATVGSTGIVSGVAAGNTTITYTLPDGCYATSVVTVSAAPAGITGTLTVCEGATTALGNEASGGTWTSSMTSVATVGSSSGIVSGVLAGNATITYALYTGCIVTAEVTVNPSPSAIGGTAVVCEGLTTTLTNSVSGGVWTSGTMSVATVGSSSGVVTGVSAGNSMVTYTLPAGCYSTVNVTVNPLPATITGTMTVCEGMTTTLSDATSSGTWSSGNTSVATVGSTSGVVSGVLAGNATITYTLPTGCIQTAVVTVNPSPSAIGGTTVVCEGLTTTLTNSVSGGVWTSNTMSVATVGSSSGVVTGVSAGNSMVTYTLPEGCYSTVNVTVNPLPATITGTMTVCEGMTTTLSDATSSGTWSSGNTSVATVGSTSGVVSGVLAGNATITYTLPTGCIQTAVVTVNPSPSAIGGTAVVCEGLTTTLTNSVSGGVWTSGTMSVATVGSSSGVVTGVSAGNSMVTYTLPEGCYSTVNVTVNPLPAAITGTMTVCEGLTTTLSDATSSGTWSSGNTSVATVGSTSGVVTGVLAGNTTVTYTLPTGCIMTAVVTVNPSPSAIGGTAVVCEGLTTTLTNSVSGGTWASSNTSVATIGTSGIVTGVAGGNATITYTLPEGCYSVKNVTVNPLPATITGTMTVCEGLTTTLSDATASGTWSSSNTSVATVGSSSGIVSGVLAGNTTITYTLPTGCIQTAVVTVNMSPAAITGTNNVCEGLTISLSDATASGTWSSSMTSVATVNMSGVVTGVAAGNATITYTLPDGCFSVMAITVNPLPASITGTTVVCEGKTNTLADASAGGTWSSANTSTATIGSATGILAGVATGNTTITYTLPTGCIMTTPVTVNPSPAAITGTNAMCIGYTTTLADATAGGTWSSSNTSIATVNTSGVVTGILNGNATITYTLPEGCYSTRLVTVYATPTAITGTTVVCEGTTSTLGNGVSGGTWSSSNYAVASISLVSGIVTGIAQGTATITYALSTGCTVTTIVTINPAPHAGTVSGPTSVGVGSMITLTDAVSGGVWSASNGNATVGSTGIVTGVSAGTVTISYSYTNSCGTAVAPLVVTVSASVGITGTGYVCIGSTTTLTNATGGGVWASSNNSIATVGSSTGVVSGVTAGTCTISYTVSGTTSTKVVTVTASVAAITGSSAVCKDAYTTLSCSVPGGTWLTNNSSIASIDPATGVVTGISAGTTTITYSFGTSCYKTFTFTVRPLPAAISTSGTVCIGSTATLTDPTSGGVMWQSSNTSVATIGSTSGILTGVSAGTTTITYVLATGCYTTTPVSVNPLPSAITGTASACAGATTTLNDADAGGTWTSGSTGIATVGSSTGVVTGVAAGTAGITYTVATGCKRTQVVTINPSPNAITGATTVCMGSTSSLSSTTTGGTWTTSTPSVATVGTSSGVVTGVSIGSSTITYTISTGCRTTAVVNVGIALDANTGTAIACTGRTTTLSNATPGGAWSSGATSIATVNATTGVVTGVTTGTASISYATGGGCRSITIVTVNPSPATITGSASVCVNSSITLSDATTGGTWSSSNTALGTVNATTGVVTGISAGTPAITYTAPNGCYQTSNITVKAIPAAIVGTKALCTGASTTFTDPTSGGVSWMSSTPGVASIGSISGVVTAVSAGTSTITFNLLSGCYTTTVVTVSATPSAGTITGPSTVVIGNTITLSDAAVAGGTWSSGTPGVATVGSASGDVTGVSAGGTTITYTVNNGCGVATTTQAITVTTSRPGGNGTAIKLADGKSLMLYPNPTSGEFTIEASEAGTLVMSTLEGKAVAKLNILSGVNAVDVPKGVAAGIYMCRFTGNSGSIVVIRLVYEP